MKNTSLCLLLLAFSVAITGVALVATLNQEVTCRNGIEKLDSGPSVIPWSCQTPLDFLTLDQFDMRTKCTSSYSHYFRIFLLSAVDQYLKARKCGVQKPVKGAILKMKEKLDTFLEIK